MPPAAITHRARGSVDPMLRIALTLPGGVTPGAFEAGAVCALVSWAQEVNALDEGAVVIDAIAGASAGALTALLAARTLLAGDDPVPAFRRAWVAAPTLHALRGLGPMAPMSLRPARRVAGALLSAPAPEEARYRQAVAVEVHLALACLRGFARPVHQAGEPADDREPLLTTTYLDWSRHRLHQIRPGGDRRQADWSAALGSALASASHPLLFPPTLLDRESERCEYRDRGFTNLPGDKLRLWYSDGGIVNNEPLARCIQVSARLDRSPATARLVLLVRSEGHCPPGASDADWTAAIEPRWTETVVRAFDILATHAVALDLLRVERFNARIRWTKRVAAEIAPFLSDSRECADRLHALLETIEREGVALGHQEGPEPDDRSEPRGIPQLFEEALLRAAGIANKREVDVAVMSAPSKPRSNGILSFLERRGREERFASGFHAMLEWIQSAPQVVRRVRPELTQRACAASARNLRRPQRADDRSLRLSPSTRIELSKLAARLAAIGAVDLRAAKRKPRAERSQRKSAVM